MNHRDEAKKALVEALYLSGRAHHNVDLPVENHVDPELNDALDRAIYHLSEAAAERAKRELSVTDGGR